MVSLISLVFLIERHHVVFMAWNLKKQPNIFLYDEFIFCLLLPFLKSSFGISYFGHCIKKSFLPITFLVVYVGAIAVLFLFVLMMLNIKLTKLKAENAHFLPVACLLGVVFVLELFVMIRLEFLPLTFSFVHSPFLSDFANSNASFIDFPLFYLNESNMRSLGQILFVEYWLQFIIVGYILLFAMVGAIVLTLQKKFLSKSQNVYFQILRNFNSCVSFYA